MGSNNPNERLVRLKKGEDTPVGTLVLVPKGTHFRSTHPQIEAGTLKRDLRINIQTSSSKWEDRLTWAGTGGYWRWCDKEEAFRIELDSSITAKEE